MERDNSFEKLWQTISVLKGCPSKETARFLFEEGARHERKQGSVPLLKEGCSERGTGMVR